MPREDRTLGSSHRATSESAQHPSHDQKILSYFGHLLAAWTGADDAQVTRWTDLFTERRRAADVLAAAEKDPRTPAAGLERLLRNDARLSAAQRAAARDALKQMLLPQIGKHIARNPEAVGVVKLLLKLGAGRIPGISICETCGIVFEPLRKGFAAKCEMCRGRPHSAPPLTFWENTYGHVGGTGMPGRTERWAIAGCAHEPCSAPFEPTFPTMRFCTTKCRQVAHREAARLASRASRAPVDPDS